MRDKTGWVFMSLAVIFCVFGAVCSAASSHVISGVVTTGDGAPLGAADVAGDNGAPSTVTDADGMYSIIVQKHWSGTVTVSKTGWRITPGSIAYNDVAADIPNQDHTAWQPTISGTVHKSDGTPLAGATVTANNGGGSATTDATGYYEIIVPYEWTGTVSATLAGYHFTDKNYTNVTTDQVNQNFSGFQPTISGYVKKADGTALEGATVSADNGGSLASTDASGYYEIIVPYDWSGTVSPDLLAYDFIAKEYTNVITGQTGQGFIGTYVGIHVNWDGSADFVTIQAAIDAATHGDIIHVADGVYTGDGNRDIDFLGKAITVLGNVKAPSQVVIECDGSTSDLHRGFNFVSGEDPNSILEGFTVRNGVGPREDVYFDRHYRSVGGAIYCHYSSPTIRNCIFNNNKAIGSRIIGLVVYFGGGAIYNRDSNPIIKECIFNLNATENYGGAIFNYRSNSEIINCKVTANSAQEHGGGIANHGCSPKVKNCTIRDNIVYGGNGGGIYNSASSTLIDNCTIEYNTAENAGGGIYHNSWGNNVILKIRSSEISGNSATSGGGFHYAQGSVGGFEYYGVYLENSVISNNAGGGLYVNADLFLNNCLILGNTTSASGGGILETSYSSLYQNSTIRDNIASNNGGGVCIYGSSSTMQNCMIIDNFSDNGGGICVSDPSTEKLVNCTVANNSALNSGGGLYLYEGYANIFSNCIIWGNTENSPGFNYVGSGFNYNCIEGLEELVIDLGVGNIEVNPFFVDSVKGDFHLKSKYGRWDSTNSQWIHDPNTSPCIDAGDPADVGWQGELWPHGGRVNMGAYGGTAAASMSANPVGNTADLNHDGEVDLGDWSLWSDDWLAERVLLDSDLDRDNDVDPNDLGLFMNEWLWRLE